MVDYLKNLEDLTDDRIGHYDISLTAVKAYTLIIDIFKEFHKNVNNVFIRELDEDIHIFFAKNETPEEIVQDTIETDDLVKIYPLTHQNIIRITSIEILDPPNPPTILAEGVDYTLDYVGGIITLVAFPPDEKDMVVDYEYWTVPPEWEGGFLVEAESEMEYPMINFKKIKIVGTKATTGQIDYSG